MYDIPGYSKDEIWSVLQNSINVSIINNFYNQCSPLKKKFTQM